MSDENKLEINKDEQDKKEKGASLVEYALLVALIAIVCIVALKLVGGNASVMFSDIATQLHT